MPAGTAACISWPRSRTRCAPSAALSAPAATSAAYSPRLWPASTRRLRATLCLPRRHTATPAASRAGWVNSVWLSCSSGPCWRQRPQVHAGTLGGFGEGLAIDADALRRARRACRPICEPWPGKTNASVRDHRCQRTPMGTGGMIRATRRYRLYRERRCRTARSVADQRRTPGETAAEGFQQQQLAALDLARTHRFVQRQRHRAGRGIAVRSTVTMTRSIDMCRRLAVASMMRRLAWCGISQSRSDLSRPLACQRFVDHRIQRLDRVLEHLVAGHHACARRHSVRRA